MTYRAASGTNTYVPTYEEASGSVVGWIRNPERFRVRQWCQEVSVKKDQGFWLKMNPDDSVRVVDPNYYTWQDGNDAPDGQTEQQDFQFIPYQTQRLAVPWKLGQKSVDQADWRIVAAHAKIAASKMMLIRTIKAATVATTAGNWGSNTLAVTDDALGGSGATWSGATTTNYTIKKTILGALEKIELSSNGMIYDETDLRLVINPTMARIVAKSAEMLDYIKGSPDAIDQQTGQVRGRNRRYGLPENIYGVDVMIENAVRTVTKKPGSATKSYVWPTAYAMICLKSPGVVAESELDFSTLNFRVYENMTVEQKNDVDNRRILGRVVDDVVVTVNAPESGFLISGLS